MISKFYAIETWMHVHTRETALQISRKGEGFFCLFVFVFLKINPKRWIYAKLGTSPMWTWLKFSIWGQKLKTHVGNASLHLTSLLSCWSWQDWKGLPSIHTRHVQNAPHQVSASCPPHDYLWHLQRIKKLPLHTERRTLLPINILGH